MQDLKRLVKIVDAGNFKGLSVFDPADRESLEGKLFQFIKLNNSQTDEEACQHLYGESKLTSSYRMLKSRLRKKLFNSLLFIKLNEEFTKECNVKFIECLSLLHQTKALLGLSEFILADKLVDQAIGVANEAELNELLVMAYDMKQIIDLVLKERKRFEQNITLLSNYTTLSAKEREATFIYNRFKFEFSLNVSNSRKLGDNYKSSISMLEKLWKDTRSSKVYDFYFILKIGECEICGHYEKILEEIEILESLIASGQVNKNWFSSKFNSYMKVYALLRLNKLDEGLLSAEQSLPLFKEGSSHWFSFLENYITLALHNKDYKLSVQLASKVLNNNVFEFPVPGIRERWGLYLRYVLLIAHKALPEVVFSVTAFRAETSNISKDKEGFNLPLVILEYLERLEDLDVEEDMELYTARFSKYASKYLKGEKEERERLFIKLLLLSMKERGERLEQKAAPVLQRLKNTPLSRDPISIVEIVPYEHLWELVLQLSHKRVKN